MSRKLLFVELSGKRPYRRDLAAEGFVVDSAFSSTDAEAMMAMSRYDAVLVSASEPSMIATRVSDRRTKADYRARPRNDCP